MLGRFVGRWQPEMALFGLVVAYVLVGLAVHGCGGGGGGGGQAQPPTSQSVRSVAEATATSVHRTIMRFVRGGIGTRLQSLRSRQNSCPTITSNWDEQGPLPNPLTVTVDYGSGCEDEEGDFFKGSFTVTIRNPQIDEYGDLVFSGLSITFNNFSDGEETLNGTFSLNETDEQSVYRLTYDLRYSNIAGCNERETFNGTIETNAPLDDEFTQILLNGEGSYSGPSGNFNLVMENLVWDLTADCEYPISGVLKVTAGGVTAKIAFSDECREAAVVINGTSSTVLLPLLGEDDPDDPCF